MFGMAQKFEFIYLSVGWRYSLLESARWLMFAMMKVTQTKTTDDTKEMEVKQRKREQQQKKSIEKRRRKYLVEMWKLIYGVWTLPVWIVSSNSTNQQFALSAFISRPIRRRVVYTVPDECGDREEKNRKRCAYTKTMCLEWKNKERKWISGSLNFHIYYLYCICNRIYSVWVCFHKPFECVQHHTSIATSPMSHMHSRQIFGASEVRSEPMGFHALPWT